MAIFDDLLAAGSDLTAVGSGSWHWDVPDGWHQGRGAWGGIVLAGLVRGAERAAEFLTAANPEASTPPLHVRGLTGVMAGPWLTGPATIKTRLVREGNWVVTIGVDLLNEDNSTAASAIVVLARDRDSVTDVGGRAWQTVAPPEVQEILANGPDHYATLDIAGAGPEFFKHLDLKPISGFPGTNDPQVTVAGWTRLTEPPVVADAAWLAAYSDIWWPTTLASTDPARPMATVSFNTDVIADPTTLNPGDYLLHVGRIEGARGGYVSETRALWSADGTLVTTTNQIVAVIK